MKLNRKNYIYQNSAKPLLRGVSFLLFLPFFIYKCFYNTHLFSNILLINTLVLALIYHMVEFKNVKFELMFWKLDFIGILCGIFSFVFLFNDNYFSKSFIFNFSILISLSFMVYKNFNKRYIYCIISVVYAFLYLLVFNSSVIVKSVYLFAIGVIAIFFYIIQRYYKIENEYISFHEIFHLLVIIIICYKLHLFS